MGSLDPSVLELAAKPPAIEPSQLPVSSDPQLILLPATSTENLQLMRINADEWSGPLSMHQYQGRELHLLDQELTKDGGCTAWVLTSKQLPPNKDGTRPVLASCETTRAHGYIARNGKLEKVITHGIGSVFTRAEHRGKGYAGRMMIELGKNLATHQQPEGDKGSFSVLYSDIGPKFYNRFGWKPFKSTHIHFKAMAADEYEQKRQSLPAVKDLYASDLANLRAVQYVEDDLRTSSQQQPDVTFVAQRPDMEHFTWHHAREEYVGQDLGRDTPQIKGALHVDTGVALVWNRVYPSNPENWQLHILHTIIPPSMQNSAEGLTALSALLLRAQREADAWNMQGGVEVWDPTDMTIAAAQNLRIEKQDKVEVIFRDEDHLCSLRWSDPALETETVWKFNEKFGWC